MSGVPLTGKIVPLNGGNFPVFEDINGQGGYRCVPTIAARDNLTTSSPLFLKAGMPVYVQANKCVYTLNVDLATWTLANSSQELWLQSAWFVNDGTGNDDNDGSALAPLKTAEQLSMRLSPRGGLYWPKQSTTLNFAAGTYLDFYINSTAKVGDIITVQGTFNTTGATIVLSAVTATNAAAGTRGQLVTASGVFVAGARIRVTTGAAVGSVTYCNGLNGDAQHAFVKAFYRESDGSLAFPAPGDSVVVEPALTKMNRFDINSSVLGNNGTGSGSLAVRGFDALSSCRIRSAGMLISFVDCTYGGPGISPQVVADGIGVDHINCRNAGAMTCNGYGQIFTGHAAQATISTVAGQLRFNAACASDAGRIGAESPLLTTQIGLSAIQFTADYELQNGAGLSAFAVGPGCFIWALARMWGATASPYASKATISSGGWFYYAAAASISFSSVADFLITGHTVAIGGTPIGYPRANCGVALTSDPAAVGVTT